MSAFRKSLLTFALSSFATTVAFAQLPGIQGVATPTVNDSAANVPDRTIVCDVNSNPQTVRVEGFAELLGDVEVVCRGILRVNPRNATTSDNGTVVLDTFNLSVTLSVPLTSRLISDPITEALMFIDDPTGATLTGVTPSLLNANNRAQNPCTGTGAVCGPYYAHDGLAGALDDNLATAATLTSAAGTSMTTGINFNSTSNPTNVFAGIRQNNQTVVFVGVPISNYDTRLNPRLLNEYNRLRIANGGTYRGQEITVGFEKRFRIKNLRGAIPGAAAANGQVFAFISIQNTSARLQLNTASAVVGFVQPGLSFRQRNVTDSGTNPTVSFASCVTVNRDLAVDATDADPFAGHFIAEYTEGYRVAFRTRGFLNSGNVDQNDPRVNYDTESGFYNTLFSTTHNLNRAGIADHGTRLRLIVRSIPANVRVFTSVAGVNGTSATIGAYGVVADAAGANPAPVSVPVFPSASPSWTSGTTLVINGTTVNGASAPAGSFAAGGSQGIFLLNNVNNVASMTWEVYAASSTQNEKVNFLVLAAYRAANNPGLGAATIQGTFAPINTTASSAGFAVPIPRFAETGSPQAGFSIGPCLTNLLYPFVTNQAGFNTGLAISNTSLTNPGTGEIIGTDANAGISPQNGTCTINYFGTTGADGAAPPPATTGVIPAGRTFTMTLASGSSGPFGTVPAAANFQGYIIAQCNFRYAHGYAFISDLGAAQLAHGYVALVMDLNANRTGITSESLGQ